MSSPEAPPNRPPPKSKLIRISTSTLADLSSLRELYFPRQRWCPGCTEYHPAEYIAQESVVGRSVTGGTAQILRWTCSRCGNSFEPGQPLRKWEPRPPSWNEFLLLLASDLLHSSAKCPKCRRHYRCDYCTGLDSQEIMDAKRTGFPPLPREPPPPPEGAV